MATEVVLSEFLREIRDITNVARKTQSEEAAKREAAAEGSESSDQNQEGTTTPQSEEEESDANSPDGTSTDLDDRHLGCS